MDSMYLNYHGIKGGISWKMSSTSSGCKTPPLVDGVDDSFEWYTRGYWELLPIIVHELGIPIYQPVQWLDLKTIWFSLKMLAHPLNPLISHHCSYYHGHLLLYHPHVQTNPYHSYDNGFTYQWYQLCCWDWSCRVRWCHMFTEASHVFLFFDHIQAIAFHYAMDFVRIFLPQVSYIFQHQAVFFAPGFGKPGAC